MRRLIFWIVLIGVAVTGCVLAAELTLRIVRPPNYGMDGQWSERDGYYVYPPGSRFVAPNEEGTNVEIAVDEKGLRNPPHTLGSADVILLGDSFVAAVNTPAGQTLADRLRGADLAVYDAGVGGLSTFQELRLLRALLKTARPHTVVLCFYLGNDFHDNYFDQSDRERDAATIHWLGMTFRPPAHKTAPPGMCARSALCAFLYGRVYLGTILGWTGDRMASFSLAELASYRLTYDAPMNRAVAKTNQAFAELAALARERGFGVVLLGIPSKAQVARSLEEVDFFDRDQRARGAALAIIRAGYSFDRPDGVARELAQRNGLPYLSLLETFRSAGALNLYYQIDAHWNAAAQALAAQRLMTILAPPAQTGEAPRGQVSATGSSSGGE